MIRNKKFVVILVGGLLFLLAGITIAYSLLQITLTTTTSRIEQMGGSAVCWQIGFTTGTITGVAAVNNSKSVECGTATATATTISGLSPVLADVGDKCAYTFTIRNSCTIAAKLDTITITKPTDTTCTINGSTMVCGNITYMLRYNSATSTNLVSVNDIVEAKSGSSDTIKTVVLTVEYTGSSVAANDFVQPNFSYQLRYVQY